MAVWLLCGECLPRFAETDYDSLASRIEAGHDGLVKLSGKDFGYDLQAWHDYLKESRDGGYTWGRNVDLPRIMKQALASAEWHEAVRQIQSATEGKIADVPDK